jgi:hypothetical protein
MSKPPRAVPVRRLALLQAIVACLALSALGAHAQPAPRVLTAVRASSPPVIDGRLDEAAWNDARPVAGFLQRDPAEGHPATDDTEIRIAYDDDALYVGVRLLDRQPGAIVRQLSRRDAAVDADAVIVYLDPHHDHVTGAQFGVSAAGVQRDALVYNDNFLDPSWDAVWESAVATDAGGWAAAFPVPSCNRGVDRRTGGRAVTRRGSAAPAGRPTGWTGVSAHARAG